MTEYRDGVGRWKTKVLVLCLVTFLVFLYSGKRVYGPVPCLSGEAKTDMALHCILSRGFCLRCAALGCGFWFFVLLLFDSPFRFSTAMLGCITPESFCCFQTRAAFGKNIMYRRFYAWFWFGSASEFSETLLFVLTVFLYFFSSRCSASWLVWCCGLIMISYLIADCLL